MSESLLYGMQVDGYVNLFYNIQTEQNMVCLYINKDDIVDDYFQYTDTLKTDFFVIFHWDFTREERAEMEKKIRNKYKTSLFVVHETHSQIIEYMCLKHCKVIITMTSSNEFLKSGGSENTIIYTILDNIARNVPITRLQTLT